MIIIHRLGRDFEFHEYDKWDGKFHGKLSGLDITEDEIIERFNTSYFRTSKKSDVVLTKVEINTSLLNKKEIRVEGFWDKKGRWHKPHKRRIKDKSSEKVSEEVDPTKESTSMTPENLKELKSFKDLGIEGGLHGFESYCAKFNDDTNAMYKVMNEGAIVGEVSTYDVSKILDWDVVPETIQANFEEKGNGSCQKWIKGGKCPYEGYGDKDDYKEIENKHFNDLSEIAVIDMITGNYDRHGGNIEIDENDHCWAIDNEDWGTASAADDFIHAIDDRAGISDVGGFSPMIRWLDKNLNEEDYLIFREKVLDNMGHVIDNKDKIINYYNKYKDSDLSIGEDADEKSITLVLLCIKQNLDYIEKYHSENK